MVSVVFARVQATCLSECVCVCVCVCVYVCVHRLSNTFQCQCEKKIHAVFLARAFSNYYGFCKQSSNVHLHVMYKVSSNFPLNGKGNVIVEY